MKQVKNIFLTSAIATSALLVTTQANAALITNWNFDLTSAWTAPILPNTVVKDGAINNDGVVGHSILKWGVDGNTAVDGWDVVDVLATPINQNIDSNAANDQSALVIKNPIITNEPITLNDIGGGIFSSGPVAGTQFFHLNNILASNSPSPSLTSAMLTDFFRLKSDDTPFELTTNPAFSVLFKETLNQTPCPGVNGTVCDDIFVVTNPGLLQESFMHQGYIYKLTISAVGLGVLDDASCAAVGAGPGCVGLKTLESGENPVQFFINLTAQVPTPTSLALLGAGLLGLGAFARKQRKES